MSKKSPIEEALDKVNSYRDKCNVLMYSGLLSKQCYRIVKNILDEISQIIGVPQDSVETIDALYSKVIGEDKIKEES